MTDIPADAPRSEDGQWWWDGNTWQAVTGSGATPAADAGGATGAAHNGTAELAAGASAGIAEITMSVDDIATVLTAAGVDYGDTSGGGDLANPDSREEYA